jgi:hypothetical protein
VIRVELCTDHLKPEDREIILETILDGIESGEIVFDAEDYCALVDKEDVSTDDEDDK